MSSFGFRFSQQHVPHFVQLYINLKDSIVNQISMCAVAFTNGFLNEEIRQQKLFLTLFFGNVLDRPRSDSHC